MSDEPYEDQYGQLPPHRQHPQHPQQQYQQPQPQPQQSQQPQQTQQWQGQTWDTQVQSTYLPPQGPAQGYGQAYGQQPYGEPHGQRYAQDPSGQGMYGQGPQSQAGHAAQAPADPSAYPQQHAQQQQQHAPAQAPPAQAGHAAQAPADPSAYPQQHAQQHTHQQQHAPVQAPPVQAAYPQAAHPQAAYAHPMPAESTAPAPAPAPAPASAPDPTPPAATGTAPLTAAEKARAEGRAQVIEPGIQPAALTALLGLLLAGGAAVGPYALLVPLVLLQAVTAAGWFRLNGMWPARQGIALAFAGGVAVDVALLAVGRENAPAAILGTLGVWVLLTLVLQLRSHAGPDERMYGLMVSVVSAALAIVAAGHLAAGPDAVTVGAVAVAVAVLARALPLPTPASVVVALLAAAGAGIAVGGVTGTGSDGALLGLGAGVCALIGHRVASYDYPSRFVHMTAGVALPLAAAAPAVYLLGRVVG
ncbi:hypothetical protein [Streptomyces antnestii]|uniref:hypothetical protein n=1 Tax=Streptomyces antnestii TaxID=2494256 RepID=UPI00167A1F40|nr:hypothetical protein [Streptomyces sp. San01]